MLGTWSEQEIEILVKRRMAAAGLDFSYEDLVVSRHLEESEMKEEIDRILEGILDPVGTFYRFSMAHATLGPVRAGNGSRSEVSS